MSCQFVLILGVLTVTLDQFVILVLDPVVLLQITTMYPLNYNRSKEGSPPPTTLEPEVGL